MSVAVFCPNKFEANCLRCGTKVKPGAGVYGQVFASWKQKATSKRSSDFFRLDLQKGTFCKDCQEYLDKEK